MLVDYMRKTLEFTKTPMETYQDCRTSVICKDGFSVSVQHSHSHYCQPRMDNAQHYTEVELGFPSTPIPETLEIEGCSLDFARYRDGEDGDIWAYVPFWMVEALIEEHGGIANMPE